MTALWLACFTDQPAATTRLLLDRGAGPDSLARWTADDGTTEQDSPLYEATLWGAVETVRELLARGADPNAGDGSPLRFAATEEIKNMIRAKGGRG